jgi:hypothetical protein
MKVLKARFYHHSKKVLNTLQSPFRKRLICAENELIPNKNKNSLYQNLTLSVYCMYAILYMSLHATMYGRALVPGVCFLLTRNFELLTRNFDLLTRNFDLVTRNFDLVTRNFDFYCTTFIGCR